MACNETGGDEIAAPKSRGRVNVKVLRAQRHCRASTALARKQFDRKRISANLSPNLNFTLALTLLITLKHSNTYDVVFEIMYTVVQILIRE